MLRFKGHNVGDKKQIQNSFSKSLSGRDFRDLYTWAAEWVRLIGEYFLEEMAFCHVGVV